MASTSYADANEALQKCLAGGAAAAISKTTTAPVDRIKLLLQLQTRGEATVLKYKGIRDCLQRVTLEQGTLSLWRGNGAMVARCIPNHALNFAIRDVYRKKLVRSRDCVENYPMFLLGTLASGGLGGATTLMILYPFDFARTRLAVECNKDGTRKYGGMLDCLKSIRKSDGLFSWYRGFSPSLQFVVASRALFFGFFDTMRMSYKNPKQLNFSLVWMMAQVSIITSGIICYPLDTVRRMMMLDAGKTVKKYNDSKSCWREIYKKNGFTGFFRGSLTNCLRSTGGALIISFYYEFAKYI